MEYSFQKLYTSGSQYLELSEISGEPHGTQIGASESVFLGWPQTAFLNIPIAAAEPGNTL